MIDWLCSKGFKVTLSPGLVLLERHGHTYDYRSIRAAFLAMGGPKSSLFFNAD